MSGSCGTRRWLLFVYYARDSWPILEVLASQFRAFQSMPGCHCVAVNLAFPVSLRLLEQLRFDVVVWHSTALGLRWFPVGLAPLRPLADLLATQPLLRVALPQDDYMLSAPLCAWMREANIERLLTPVGAEAARLAYGASEDNPWTVDRVLTHYLTPRDIVRVQKHARPWHERDWDISYRAWAARPWVGDFGQLKIRIADAARRVADELGLKANISTAPRDTLVGDAWLALLGNSRAVVGVEGGSSIHDPDGQISRDVEAAIAANPQLDYAALRATALAAYDQEVVFRALSPRHLEAAMMRTAQILVRGEYSGVLEAGVHYIPIAEDFTDLPEALAHLSDPAVMEPMIARAYTDLIASGRFGWDVFFQRHIAPHLKPDRGKRPLRHWIVLARLQLTDRLQMLIIRLEVSWARSPRGLRHLVAMMMRPVKGLVRRPTGWR